jgi:two-component system cell cycle response regulator
VLAADGGPMCFAVFDLNGFKQYNDSYGHLAGDALLARLGKNLARYVGHRGTAYRLGGDEFCLLWHDVDERDLVVEGACGALAEQGDGFVISSAYGSVLLPSEADTAMRRSRQRRRRARRSARRHAHAAVA